MPAFNASILAIAMLATAPAAAPQPYISCVYFDFLHDINYTSRIFVAPADFVAAGNDPTRYDKPFAEAIHAEFGIVPDARHVECGIVGAWRLKDELAAQARLDADPTLLTAKARRVAWPVPAAR